MTVPKEKPEQKARRLANEHWNWIEGFLNQERERQRFLFIEGFLHGDKHGRKEKEDERTATTGTKQKAG